MPNWIPSYELLDPVQREFVEGYHGGNVCLHGYPGSGKSILLVYLLRRLKQEHPEKTYAVISYTHALADLFRTGFNELGMDAVPVMTPFELQRSNRMFDYIFCDEIQDLSPETLSMIKSKARDYMIAAGDTNQSIYSLDPLSNTPPIHDIHQAATILGATTTHLNIIYRLTRSVIEAVKMLMPQMANNWTAMDDITHEDVQIKLRKASSLVSECRYVYDKALENCSNNERTAILIPTHKEILKFVNQVLENNGKLPWTFVQNSFGKPDYNRLNDYLRSQGIKMMYVGNSYGSLYRAEQEDLIVVMTYASSKGLDFKNVYMPYLKHDLWITTNARKSLTTFMVAMTRSSLRLMMSYQDVPSGYIQPFRGSCSFFDETQAQARQMRPLF